jgi:hypothetical protein
MEDETAAAILVGPAGQHRRHMQHVLHPVQDHGPSGSSLSPTSPLRRNSFGPCVARKRSRNISSDRG